MNVLSNISFKSLYGFTNPQVSFFFMAIVNVFFLSLLFCHDHDHDDSVFYIVAKYLWFASLLVIGYVKVNSLRNGGEGSEALAITPDVSCLNCIPQCLNKLTDPNNLYVIFGGLLLLNVLENIFGGMFVLFLAFNGAFTLKYLRLKGIIRDSNQTEKYVGILKSLFDKIPRFNRGL